MKGLKQKLTGLSLAQQIRAVIAVIVAVVVLLVISMMALLVSFSSQYDTIVSNFTIASRFNNEFRAELDGKMYWFVAGRNTFEEADPLSDIEEARNVVAELVQNTTYSESLAQLRTIKRQLTALENGIIEIGEGPPYAFEEDEEGNLVAVSPHDWRMERLPQKVYLLTTFVEESMLQYIFHETTYLAEMHARVNASVRSTIITVSALTIILMVVLAFFAMRTANGISRPLKELGENIRLVGEGDFTVRPVQSSNNELQTLSDTVDGMVERIVVLMDNVREEQENLRRTELELLQAQINPHFLYNAFDTVIWLAEDHQDEQVVSTVESLSTFFRTSLSKGRNFITVREEELHIKSYLEIQQTRYRDILEYELDFPPELSEYSMLKLTLQPLVENALYHGVKNKRGMGKIVVSARKFGEELHFTVEDNGKGMTAQELAQLRAAMESGRRVGYGLTNVQERIQLYYGKNYGITFESEYGSFTRVYVRIPAKNSPP